MMPFVWSLVGEDAGEKLTHIITRKEAERRTGGGEFWWGLGTPLGDGVESTAIVNEGTLPALFSALKPKTKSSEDANQRIQVWNGWHSIRGDGHHGAIPDHVLVTGYAPKKLGKPTKAHYALVCRSDRGTTGFLTQQSAGR
jgi:hypothetical protein